MGEDLYFADARHAAEYDAPLGELAQRCGVSAEELRTLLRERVRPAVTETRYELPGGAAAPDPDLGVARVAFTGDLASDPAGGPSRASLACIGPPLADAFGALVLVRGQGFDLVLDSVLSRNEAEERRKEVDDAFRATGQEGWEIPSALGLFRMTRLLIDLNLLSEQPTSFWTRDVLPDGRSIVVRAYREDQQDQFGFAAAEPTDRAKLLLFRRTS